MLTGDHLLDISGGELAEHLGSRLLSDDGGQSLEQGGPGSFAQGHGMPSNWHAATEGEGESEHTHVR
ncbi:MAG: hypothetical protein EDR02_13035 [Actinobacteria bacterium]|nr:MAG: hypothetical protein EDR02_13035 [Actinomycetota bacterium]